MIRIGFIGAGGMGFTHVTGLKALSEELPVKIVAVADKLQERRERATELWPEAELFEDGDDLLQNGEYDLIYIATPSYLHAHFAVAAMKKGCDVFCEKPLCLTEEEVALLQTTMAETKRKFMVGQVVRMMPEYKYLKELIDNKTYGELHDIVMQRVSGNVPWGYQDWFHDAAKSGTVILDLHIHDLDFLRYVLGEPDTAEPVHVTRFDSGLINHIITHLTFGKVQATCEGEWHLSDSVPFTAGFRADFDHASVVFNTAQFEGKLLVCTDKGEMLVHEIPQDERKINNGMNISSLGAYYQEDKYFIETLLNGTANEIAPMEEGIKSVQLAKNILVQAEKWR